MKTKILAVLLICVAFYVACKHEPAEPAKRVKTAAAAPVRKVLLISIDCLRPDFVSVYHKEMRTTPHLDRLAKQSVLCENVTAQASTTAPSHKSILYSLYPAIHKTTINSVPDEKLKNPLEILQSKGFTTAGFTGGGQISRDFGFGRGFHTYWEPRDKKKI